MRGFLILVSMAVAGWPQDFGPPKPIFPSDGMDPKQGGGLELLAAVCAGGADFQCPCPDYTAFHGDGDFSLARVTKGHFLSPASEDAVLWMEGCEPHASLFGGSILLTRRSGKWRMQWYKAGVKTDECHKIPVGTGRDILVCVDQDGGQGYFNTVLYIENLAAPSGPAQRPFFGVGDTAATCGDSGGKPGPLVRGYIDRVSFDAKRNLSVVVRYGQRSMTRKEVQQCLDELDQSSSPTFIPQTKSYQIDLLFNGRTYKVAPWSAKTAQLFRRP